MTNYPTREYIIRETTYPDATKQELIGELVRCKDCKHWQDYNGDHFALQNCSRNNHVMKHGNDYCSWAERKDGEHDRG